MAVDFPVGAGHGVTLIRAPPADCLVRLAEPAVGAKVYRRGDRAGGRGRADNFAVPGERGIQFDAHFQVDHIIPVERDVPARPHDLLRADDAPYGAAGVGNDSGEFLQARPTAHDSEGTTAELLESDVVFHANHPGWLTGSRPSAGTEHRPVPDGDIVPW